MIARHTDGAMQTSAELVAPCAPSVLAAHVTDLDRYPAWMGLVHEATAVGGDPPAWAVELRTRVGPLARSKRLRMARTVVHDAPDGGRTVVFEREEHDGRSHAPWVLRVDLAPVEGGTRLRMHLSYGGSLWTGGILQRVLDDEIRRGSERLLTLVSDGPTH